MLDIKKIRFDGNRVLSKRFQNVFSVSSSSVERSDYVLLKNRFDSLFREKPVVLMGCSEDFHHNTLTQPSDDLLTR